LSQNRLVPVYIARGELEAQVIKSLLESQDIPCLLQSEAAPSVLAFAIDGLGEVRVMVRVQDEETATKLLEGEHHA